MLQRAWQKASGLPQMKGGVPFNSALVFLEQWGFEARLIKQPPCCFHFSTTQTKQTNQAIDISASRNMVNDHWSSWARG